MNDQRTLVVGIGSPHGDDQVGWIIADRLRSMLSPAIDVKCASTPSQLLDWLTDVDRLIVCDACEDTGISPVDCHRWQWPTPHVASVRSSSSHSFGLPSVLGLAEQLGTLPANVIVHGITGHCFDAFADVSSDAERKLQKIAECIAAEVLSDSGQSSKGATVHA